MCVQEIRPYETKPIARANFFGREAVNHTSFIRVKTNLGDTPSIVLPVEVEVSETSGLYLSRELLDFGILKSGGEWFTIFFSKGEKFTQFLCCKNLIAKGVKSTR